MDVPQTYLGGFLKCLEIEPLLSTYCELGSSASDSTDVPRPILGGFAKYVPRPILGGLAEKALFGSYGTL